MKPRTILKGFEKVLGSPHMPSRLPFAQTDRFMDNLVDNAVSGVRTQMNSIEQTASKINLPKGPLQGNIAGPSHMPNRFPSYQMPSQQGDSFMDHMVNEAKRSINGAPRNVVNSNIHIDPALKQKINTPFSPKYTLPETKTGTLKTSHPLEGRNNQFLDYMADDFVHPVSKPNVTTPLKGNIPNAPIYTGGNANRVVFGNGTFGTHSPVMDNLVSRTTGNTSSKTNRVVNSSVQPKRIVTKQYGPRTASNPSANRVPTNKELINGVKPGESFLGSIGATAGALSNSFMKNIGEAGVFKNAMIGTVQSSAIGGAAGGTLSYLQGNDPWEGAKTGMVRGALIGGGYQGLKVATYSRSAGKGLTGIKSNLKQIGRGVNQTYQAHTVDGLAAMRQNGKMSNQLKKILMANQDSKIAEQVLLK